MTDTNIDNTGLINNGDGITFKYVLSVVETSYFASIYSIQNQLNDVKLYRKNYSATFWFSFLEYLQIIPFLVHGLQYGEVSLAWARFARWIQLQLPIWTYPPFFIAFWVAAISVLVLLSLIVTLGVGHYFKFPAIKKLASLSAVSLTLFFQCFYPAIFYLLAIPWFCSPQTNNLFVIVEPTACFEGSNIIAIIIGTFGVISVIGLAYYNSLIKSSVEPVLNDLSVTTGWWYRFQFYLTIAFMTINKYWIANAIGGVDGHWWEAVFNLIALAWLFGTLVYLLPYQVPEGNYFKGAAVFSLFWIACVSFMSINLPPNPFASNRNLDYILITGLLPFGFFGEYIIRRRYAFLNTLAIALVAEVKIAHENKRRAAAKAADIAKDVKASEKKVIKKVDPKDKKDPKAKGAATNKTTATNATATAGGNTNAKQEAEKAQAAAQKAALDALNVVVDDSKKRNTRLYLPRILQDYDAGINTIENVGRLLWFHTDDKNSIEAAANLYEAAEKAYPEVPFIRILRASFSTFLSTDPSVHLPKLDAIKKMEPGVNARYYVFKRTTDIRDRAKVVGSSNGENTLDLIAYIEFQNIFAETKKYNNKAIDAIREFWVLFLQKSITPAAFNRAAKEIEYHSQRALMVYKSLLIKFPKNPQVLTSYAYFLDLVLRNTDEAQRNIRRADEQKAREAEEARNGNVAGTIDSQAVVAIAEDGSIDQVNLALMSMFGYHRNEILGRNIKIIVPSPWKEKHDGILARYRATGISKVIGVPQTLYGHHKEQYAFNMKLLVQERRKENGERNFIGMIQLVNQDSKNAIVIINEVGIIRMVTKLTLDLFGGYHATQLIGKNVVVLMIDYFAAGHDTYLRRYRETGDAKLIGTAGRNVPCKKKDGSTFPGALTVEELYIDGDRYFLANIQDTSNTVGNIFIDGFGTIQNSDMGIQQLLGYKKESIIGKNIKGIMPPPYCDYHDMYLERFRRTKVSNILRSVEGRILPAVHADGTVIQVRAIIQRADSGDSSASGGNQTMLFKGTIKRGDLNGAGGANSRRGYMNDYEIILNKAGVITKMNRKVLNMLGHASDRSLSDFVGQPIEVLVPVLPDRPSQQKSIWFTRALKSPELNFYLLMANKNYTLIPVSFCLVEKDDGSIQMRIRDLTEMDALITIDELGNVLTLNEDAFMLLGNEPDEVIGRNIKYIQPPEVAEKHDAYLLRYKETRVARVVGIARTVDAMHRDGALFSTEIQVTEQITTDGNKTFIGRLRHLRIEQRIDKNIITQYFVVTSRLAGSNAVSGATVTRSAISGQSGNYNRSAISGNNRSGRSGASKGTKLSFKGKRSSSRGSAAGMSGHASIVRDDEGNISIASSLNASSTTGGTSSISSNTKFINLLNKLKAIKNSTKEDPSTSYLGSTLLYIWIVYTLFFGIGLIVTNVLPTPIPYYNFLSLLVDTDVIINEVIYGARMMQVTIGNEELGKNAGYCNFWNQSDYTRYIYNKDQEKYFPEAPELKYTATWDSNPNKPTCPWTRAGIESASVVQKNKKQGIKDDNAYTMYPLFELLPEFVAELEAINEELNSGYAKIRKPGDEFDKVIQGEFHVKQFVNGSAPNGSTLHSVATDFTLFTFWNVMGNFANAVATLSANMDLEEHSIRAWNFIIGNRNDFTLMIKDMTDMIPGKSKAAISNNMIFHFIMALLSIGLGAASFFFFILPRIRQVQLDRERILRLLLLVPKSNVYDLVHNVYESDDSEEDLEDEEDEEEDVEDVGDAASESQASSRENGDVNEAQEITVVSDRSWGIYLIFIIGLAVLTVPSIAHAIYRFVADVKNLDNVDLIADIAILYHYILAVSWQPFGGVIECPQQTLFCLPYKDAMKTFDKSLHTLDEAYKDAIIKMENNPDVQQVFTRQKCFESPNGMSRCLTKEDKRFFPEGYLTTVTHGLGNIIQSIILRGLRIENDVKMNKHLTDETEVDFWFLYELVLHEGEAGINTAFLAAKKTLQKQLLEGLVAANITYAISLVVAFVIFFLVFGSVRKAIHSETRYNRGVLFMVPHDVLRNTKAMIEYIETLNAAIN